MLTEKQQQAQQLYMTQGLTQKQIADEVGVSERTVHTWIHQHAWDKLKRAAYQAPAVISNNLCSQLVELQDTIAKREPGLRFPTPQEAEVTRKLIMCIDKMKKYPSVAVNMQVLETFRNFIRPHSKEVANEVAWYQEKFLTGTAINGFMPYEMEYGVEQVAPILPLYDEPETDPAEKPCRDCKDCHHPEQCGFPDCTLPAVKRDALSPDVYKRHHVRSVPAITEQERRQQYTKYMLANGFTEEQLAARRNPPPADTGSIPQQAA